MDILVINCGSSSIKADVLDAEKGTRRLSARVERVGTPECQLRIDEGDAEALGEVSHDGALQVLLPRIFAQSDSIAAVGHRVVHGGEHFDHPVRIDDEVEATIEELAVLAPLHNPANLAGIRAARALCPDRPHIAVFDTAFHATLPRRARSYALPAETVEKHGFRRYGFHGPSHHWVAHRAADWLDTDIRDLRLITCHLGNGCSIAAVEYGRSIETSMGMTPLEGLVMGTRSGDVDPGLLLEWMRRDGLSVDEMDRELNRNAGLSGLSGVGNDLRDIVAGAAEGDERCRLAIHVFTHRLRKYIGAYAAVMGGVDAIVFTAGIGENSPLIRHRVAQRLGFLGVSIDEDRNRDAKVTLADPVYEISRAHSRTRLLCVKTDESHAIARSTAKLAEELDRVDQDLRIPIAVSARHIHLTRKAIAVLFGEGYELTPYKPLSQPGQFACEERLTVVGPKRSIEGVRVLGPPRGKNQVEISRTDEFFLGIDAPVRDSGDLKNSAPITLEGPAGRLHLEEGLICARRHIHMTLDDAARFGVKDRDVVEIAIESDKRDLIFGDVLIRAKNSYKLEMHIDTDEANAAEIRPGHSGVLAETNCFARLRKRHTER